MKKLFIPPVFLLLSLLLIPLFYFLFPAFNRVIFPFNLIGLVIVFVGVLCMSKARDLFKKHQTTLEFEKSSFLITGGIFAKTRNPMYTGMFLLLLGIGTCFMNCFSILTAFGFLLLIQCVFIPKEEKLMVEAFGEEYLRYKKKVSKWGLSIRLK
jgi:protein-S-isoprenylcysteine O-methyltransferase Ste14